MSIKTIEEYNQLVTSLQDTLENMQEEVLSVCVFTYDENLTGKPTKLATMLDACKDYILSHDCYIHVWTTSYVLDYLADEWDEYFWQYLPRNPPSIEEPV